MPVPIKMLLSWCDTGQEELFETVISSAEDWATLLSFRDEAIRLSETEWFAAGMDGGYTVSFNQTTGLSLTLRDNVTRAQVVEVIHGLRPFMLKEEHLFFNRVRRMLGRYLRHPQLTAELQHAQKRFDGEEQSGVLTISRNGMQVNSQHTLNLWLNAFEFHRDRDKTAALQDKLGRTPDDLTLAIFRSLLVSKVDAIMRIARWISEFEAQHLSGQYEPLKLITQTAALS